MNEIIYVGEVGTIFELIIRDKNKTAIDISTATVMKFYFLKPDGTKMAKDGFLADDGKDGIMHYKSVAGDISVAGKWLIQGWVKLSDGQFFTAKDTIPVHDTLYTD
jgi:hypothetical protein